MLILGLNAYHSDASVALMRDGALVWAEEEERYSRIKHASGFPVWALRACLEENIIAPSEIHTVVISKNSRADFLRKMLYVQKCKSETTGKYFYLSLKMRHNPHQVKREVL